MDNDLDIGIKLELLGDKKESISIMRETLSRIGILNRQKKVLNPSCYLYEHINNNTNEIEYYLCHFKELFTILNKDGVDGTNKNDISRRDNIVNMFKNWGLVDADISVGDVMYIFVLPFKEKKKWKINHMIDFRKLKRYGI